MSETNTSQTRPARRGRGPMQSGMPGEKAKDFKGTLKKLLKYASVYRAALIIVIAFAMGSTVFSIAGPKVLSQATTEIFTGLMSKIGGTGGIDFTRSAISCCRYWDSISSARHFPLFRAGS